MSILFDIATPLLDSFRQLDSVGNSRPCDLPRSVSELAFGLLDFGRRQPEDLAEALHSSILSSANRINRVSLAVTGLSWLGAGVQSVQQEMVSIIRSARREIALCAYSITSGAGTLLDEITEAAGQGVLVTLVVNNLRSQPADIQERMQSPHTKPAARIRIFDFNPDNPQNQLHAKVLVADRAAALIGSANLSFHGMVSNHELALVVRGPIAEEIAARIDLLTNASRRVDSRVASNDISD